MEKAETILTVTDCHRCCREDTKSLVPDGMTCIRSKIACLYRDEKSAYQVATSESAVVHRENTKRRPREIGTVAQKNCVHFSICACHPEKEIKRDKHKRKEDT